MDNFRDHIIQINEEISNALLDGIEWVSPFIPWIVSTTIVVSLGWFWVFG